MTLSAHQLKARWRALCLSDDAEDTEALEAVELAILSREPTEAADVALMLDVVIAQNGDSRYDGLDILALKTARRWVLGTGPSEGTGRRRATTTRGSVTA